MVKSNLLKALFAVTLAGGILPAHAQETKVSPEEENAIATMAIEKLLNSIRLSSCDFDVMGSSKADESQSVIDQLSLDCMAYLSDKSDLEIPVMGAEKGDGFGALIRVSTKNIYVHFTLQQEQGQTVGVLKFYSSYDRQKAQWLPRPVDVSVAILNGSKVMNGEVIALQLSEARVVMAPDTKDKTLSIVKGECTAKKKVFHLGTMRDELRPTDCRFEGIHNGEGLSQFNFAFKSVAPQKRVP